MTSKNNNSGRVQNIRINGPGTATVRLHGRDVSYRATCATGPKGPQVLSLTLTADSDRPLTVSDMRAVPLRRIAAAVANAVPLPGASRSEIDWEAFAEPERPRKAASGKPRGRPRALTDEDHQLVADMARKAVEDGKTVRRALSQQLRISMSTVDTRLRKAEQRGFLTPGELPRGVKRQ